MALIWNKSRWKSAFARSTTTEESPLCRLADLYSRTVCCRRSRRNFRCISSGRQCIKRNTSRIPRAAEHIVQTTVPDFFVSSDLEALVKTAATEFFIQTNAALKKHSNPIHIAEEQFVFQTAMSRCSAHIRIPGRNESFRTTDKRQIILFLGRKSH